MNVFFLISPHHKWKTYFKLAGYFVDSGDIALMVAQLDGRGLCQARSLLQ